MHNADWDANTAECIIGYTNNNKVSDVFALLLQACFLKLPGKLRVCQQHQIHACPSGPWLGSCGGMGIVQGVCRNASMFHVPVGVLLKPQHDRLAIFGRSSKGTEAVVSAASVLSTS